MPKMIVRAGETLLYPDGHRRGGPGYVVDTDARHEVKALGGQLDKLEPCADYVSADAADVVHLTAEAIEMPSKPKPKKKTKKTKKKKATKK